jgi:hypothetical protein
VIDSNEYKAAVAHQATLKEMANSMYGILGYQRGRYYNMQLAEAITLAGQHLFKTTQEYFENKGHTVIYGDSVTFDTCVPIKINNELRIVQMNELYELFEKNKNIFTLTKNARWKKILRVIRHQYNKPVYNVWQPYGFVSTTADHSFYANNNLVSPLDFKEKEEFETSLKLDSITKKMKFTNELKEIYVPAINKKVKIDNNLAAIIGMYIAEGSIVRRNKSIYKNTRLKEVAFRNCRVICNHDHALVKEIYKKAQKVFGKKFVKMHLYKYDNNTMHNNGNVELRPNDAQFAQTFYEWCGYSSANKHLPDWIFKTNKQFFEELIYWYELGDGDSTRAKRDFSIGNVGGKSRKLTSQMWFILKNFYDNMYIKFKFYSKKNCYAIFWTDLNKASYRSIMCVERTYRRKSYRSLCTKKLDGYVYDVEVKDDHTFVDCMGMIPLHNTDSVFVKFKDEIMSEEAEKESKEASKHIAEHLMKEFNIDKSYISLEYDKKFKRFIIISKKRYSGLLEELDGKKVDKIYTRGLEMIRKDTTEYAKNLQVELFELLLRHDTSIATIRKWIKDKKEKYLNETLTADDLKITLKISKPFETYKSNSLHIKIAKQLKAKNREMYIGMPVPFIVTESKPRLNGVYFEDFDGKYDIKYYWDKRFYPQLLRVLCSCFPDDDWMKYYIGPWDINKRTGQKSLSDYA